jgi:hypothetical protein
VYNSVGFVKALFRALGRKKSRVMRTGNPSGWSSSLGWKIAANLLAPLKALPVADGQQSVFF